MKTRMKEKLKHKNTENKKYIGGKKQRREATKIQEKKI